MSSDDVTPDCLPKHGCFTFMWNIENFSFSPHGENDCLESPRFTIEFLDDTEWYLGIFPGRHPVTCHVYRPDNGADAEFVTTNYMYAFDTADGTPKYWCDMRNLTFKKGTNLGYIEMDRRNKNFREIYLPNDTLTVIFHMWKSNDHTTVNTRCTARTRISVERRMFDYQIRSFLKYKCRHEVPVRMASKSWPSFDMILSYDGGAVYDEKLVVKIKRRPKAEKKSIFMACKITALRKDGSLGFSSRDEHLFNAVNDDNEWLFPPFVRVNRIAASADLYLEGDRLKLRCEFAIASGIAYNAIEECSFGELEDHSATLSSEADCETLKNDLLSMCNQGTLCDVKLQSGEVSLPAHWLVICARSDVFKAMFDSDMAEKESGIVNIPNLEADDLKRFLGFMYTDTLEDLTFDSGASLYAVADLFQIEELKRKCRSFLVAKMSVSNVCACLQFGELYQDGAIMSAVKEFIFDHSVEVLKSDDWYNLMATDSSLTAKIMLDVFCEKL